MIVAVPGSVGALDPDQVDMSTLLAQENPGMLYHRSMLHEGSKSVAEFIIEKILGKIHDFILKN